MKLKRYYECLNLGVIISIITVLLFSCSPTRRLTENQYLLTANKVVELKKLKKNEKDDIQEYIQQKPNRKVFGFYRFYLQLYNLPNPDKLDSLRELREKNTNANLNNWNDTVKTKKKNYFKNLKDTIRSEYNKTYLMIGEWLQKIGEPPALLDSFKIDKTVDQLTKYAQNKGFFQVKVRDSVVTKNQKAKVYYIIDRGPAYYIDSIKYDVSNSIILDIIQQNQKKSFLKKGMKYDLGLFDEERERITKILRNQGFFLFRKDFIRFEIDTTLGNQHLQLKLQIKDPELQYLQEGDTLSVTKHKQFLIRNIYVIPKYQLKEEQYYRDTIKYKDYQFLFNNKINFNPKVLSQSVFFLKNQFFNTRAEEKTQRGLADLRNFKYIHIRYEPEFSEKTYDVVDCYIELSPSPKQNLGVELQGTNTEGNLGVSLSSSYQNKNLFKGAEILEFKIMAGAEVQVLQGDSANIDYNKFGPFNTLELGAQLSLVTPRFLFPINISKVKKRARPKTRTTLSVNFQSRPDYDRIVGSLQFGYEWQSTNMANTYSIKHIFNAGEASLIKIWKGDSFASFINQIDDQFVINSFTDHYIQGMSYTFIYSNQDINNPGKSFLFLRANGQIGGNLLNLISFIGKDQPIDGYHTVFGGIRYAQYARMDVDFRFYGKITPAHTIATRAYIGIGVPYGNSTVLPFEKSFFTGGANDLRAWLPRTLGPGSYHDTTTGRVDQIGDIKILVNAEYRFKIYRFIEGAIFADFGNIWLIREDANRPNGNFDFSRFWNEFALGSGVGLRLNFNFFIFRLDVAMPFRDPTKPEGERWVISNLEFKDVRWNIGIGYPF